MKNIISSLAVEALREAYLEAAKRYADRVLEEQRCIAALNRARCNISAAADTCDRTYLKWQEARERMKSGK